MAESSAKRAALGRDLINGREIPGDIPKKRQHAAILIAYTGSAIDYNVKRLHGRAAKEPPTLLNVVDDLCRIFDYAGD